MRWSVEPGRFLLVGFDEPPSAADLACLDPGPGQVVREGGETTLLVPAQHDAAVRERHPGARVEQDLCWIRFQLPMSWELVGFLALVTGALAQAGVPLGCVCGFARDHLFVAAAHLDTTRAVLARLFPERP